MSNLSKVTRDSIADFLGECYNARLAKLKTMPSHPPKGKGVRIDRAVVESRMEEILDLISKVAPKRYREWMKKPNATRIKDLNP